MIQSQKIKTITNETIKDGSDDKRKIPTVLDSGVTIVSLMHVRVLTEGSIIVVHPSGRPLRRRFPTPALPPT